MAAVPLHANPKANFFLVGAPKAGTTSVDRLLRGHPEVFLSPIKEPCHFCPDVNAQLASQHGASRLDLDAYLGAPRRPVVHLYPVSAPGHYARLYDGAAGRRIVGECSTYYLSSAVAAERIRAYNPDAKILVLTREPLARIRSHYAMDRSLGLATRPLPELVEEELALGARAHWGNCRYYVGASRYGLQIAEYTARFPAGHVCVLAFERLVAEPERELRRLFAFLGIQPPAQLALPRENRTRAARFEWLHSGLRQSGIKPMLRGLWERSAGTRVGRMARSMYYRDKAEFVSQEDLQRVRALLREQGMESPMEEAA
ncbi:MAG: sulfotransferase family protein [Lysobacteraceae bacterium]